MKIRRTDGWLYLYNGNLHTWKDGLYIETWPWNSSLVINRSPWCSIVNIIMAADNLTTQAPMVSAVTGRGDARISRIFFSPLFQVLIAEMSNVQQLPVFNNRYNHAFTLTSNHTRNNFIQIKYTHMHLYWWPCLFRHRCDISLTTYVKVFRGNPKSCSIPRRPCACALAVMAIACTRRIIKWFTPCM